MSREAIGPKAVVVKRYGFDGFWPIEMLDVYRELRSCLLYPKSRSIFVRSSIDKKKKSIVSSEARCHRAEDARRSSSPSLQILLPP